MRKNLLTGCRADSADGRAEGRTSGPYPCITWYVDEQGISHLKLVPGINSPSESKIVTYFLH